MKGDMMTRPYFKTARKILFFTIISLFAWSADGQIAPHGVIKLKDSNIEYFSEGKGQPIVLLPGGSLTVGYMEGLSHALAKAGFQAVRINFRGSGKSTGSGEGVTLHTLANDVAGHAFGNRVARMLAADHPELVHSVILFAAGGKVPPKPAAE